MDWKKDNVGVGKNKGVLNIRERKYDDLRQLESAIREAYVAKELKAQVVEAQAMRVAEEARERLQNEMCKRSIKEAAKRSEEKAREIKSAKISYGVELRNVVNSKEKEKVEAFEIERKERKILEQVSRVIEETREKRKIFEKLQTADQQSRELRIFREIKEIKAQKDAEILEAETQENLKYNAETERRVLDLKKARKERELARESVIEIVSNSLLESRLKKLEIESIIADIVAEEKLFEEEFKLRMEEERIRVAREEEADELERHRILIEERKLRNAIEEEEFALEIMRKVLDDKRTEMLTADAKRRKKIEYRNALETIIEERRNRRNEEIIKLEESLRDERTRAEAYRKRIKDLRKRLLLQHAGNVAEFIASDALSFEEREIISTIFHPTN